MGSAHANPLRNIAEPRFDQSPNMCNYSQDFPRFLAPGHNAPMLNTRIVLPCFLQPPRQDAVGQQAASQATKNGAHEQRAEPAKCTPPSQLGVSSLTSPSGPAASGGSGVATGTSGAAVSDASLPQDKAVCTKSEPVKSPKEGEQQSVGEALPQTATPVASQACPPTPGAPSKSSLVDEGTMEQLKGLPVQSQGARGDAPRSAMKRRASLETGRGLALSFADPLLSEDSPGPLAEAVVSADGPAQGARSKAPSADATSCPKDPAAKATTMKPTSAPSAPEPQARQRTAEPSAPSQGLTVGPSLPVEVEAWLRRNGFSPHAKQSLSQMVDQAGFDPLQRLCQQMDFGQLKEEDREMLQLLLQHEGCWELNKLTPKSGKPADQTPLGMVCVVKGGDRCVKALLDARAAPKAPIWSKDGRM